MEEYIRAVWDSIGPGYSESVYHRALEVLCRTHGIQYDSEVIIPITYLKHTIGNVRCDMIVDGVILELKSVSKLTNDHRLQLQNYLKLTGLQSGLLVNFGPSLMIEHITSCEQTLAA